MNYEESINCFHPLDRPFLDQSILELYRSVSSLNTTATNLCDPLNSDLSLDLDRLDSQCKEQFVNIGRDIGAQYVLAQAKLIQIIDDRYEACNDQLWNKIERNLDWLGQEWKQNINEVIHFQWNNREEGNLFRIAVLSSCLEQCLGNLVLNSNLHVPPLLKDLLQELSNSSVIDCRLVHLLSLLVGPPYCLNVRNLSWHGFLEPNVIGTKYWHFLLCLTVTIGQTISSTQITRRQLHNFDEYEAKVVEKCPNLVREDILHEMSLQLTASILVSARMENFWKMFFHLARGHNQNLQGLSFCLLLPLLEAALRYLYCFHNRISFDYLSAMMGEYYVTFEDIFDYQLDGQRFLNLPQDSTRLNRLYRVMPREMMITGLDALLLPEGIRFRDRIGHGQVDLASINHKVGDFVLHFVLQALKIPSSETKASIPQSLFHGTSSFCATIQDCLARIKRIDSKNIQDTFELELDRFESTKRDLMHPCIYKNVACEELIASSRAILANVVLTLDNMERFLIERLELARRHELRERQRNNLEALVNLCPTLLTILTKIVVTFCQTWINLEVEVKNYETNRKQRRRKAKALLKFLQNAASKSQMSQNKWTEVSELLEKAWHAIK